MVCFLCLLTGQSGGFLTPILGQKTDTAVKNERSQHSIFQKVRDIHFLQHQVTQSTGGDKSDLNCKKSIPKWYLTKYLYLS